MPDLVLVDPDIVAEEMCSEMAPAVGQQHIYLIRRDGVGEKFFIYKSDSGGLHGEGRNGEYQKPAYQS
jgi:hypothetical protein